MSIEFLKDEIDLIADKDIKSVTEEILNNVFAENKVSKKTLDYTKKTIKFAQSLAETRGYTSLAKDVITSASLLHDMYVKQHKILHPIMIRHNHQEELRKLDPAIAENICSIVEGHHGYESIIPKIASKEGTIEQILTDASRLAQADV